MLWLDILLYFLVIQYPLNLVILGFHLKFWVDQIDCYLIILLFNLIFEFIIRYILRQIVSSILSIVIIFTYSTRLKIFLFIGITAFIIFKPLLWSTLEIFILLIHLRIFEVTLNLLLHLRILLNISKAS